MLPLTLNLYMYCGGDPINYTDPTVHGFLKKLFKKLVKAATKSSSRKASRKTTKKSTHRASATVRRKAVVKRVSSATKKVTKKIKKKAKKTTKTIKKAARKIFDRYVRGSTGVSKELHYSRNDYSEHLPKTINEAIEKGWNSNVPANAHQFSSREKSNIKYVSPNGRSEVVFNKNGRVVTDPRDVGTYNFAPSNYQGNIIQKGVAMYMHYRFDIVPYVAWGNDERDAQLTTPWKRAKAVLGLY